MALLVAPLAIERPDGMISGVLLVVVLAAVVLGPAQAAVVGLAGILADSVWYRARAHTWIRPRAALGNVTAYAVFPLVAGWVALALIDRHGSVPAVAGVVTAVHELLDELPSTEWPEDLALRASFWLNRGQDLRSVAAYLLILRADPNALDHDGALTTAYRIAGTAEVHLEEEIGTPELPSDAAWSAWR